MGLATPIVPQLHPRGRFETALRTRFRTNRPSPKCLGALLLLVNLELRRLRRRREPSIAEGLEPGHQRLVTEALPALTGIPERDHDPAIIGRARCVIGLALGKAAVGGMDAGDRCFVLILRATGKPVDDPESRHVASQISTPTVVADPNPSASRARHAHSESSSKRGASSGSLSASLGHLA